MRRFLDWTAQTAGGSQPPPPAATKRRDSQQQQQQPQQARSQQPNSTFMQSQQSPNPARDLEIQHLIKLLHEIKYYQASSSPLPSAAGSQNQREFVDKVHRTVPLFLNVFGSKQPATMSSMLMTASESSLQSSIDHLDHYAASDSISSPKPTSPLPPMHPMPMERFPDLLPFAFTIARLFVSEVRQRASNKHAEDASLAILRFLNIKSEQINEPNRVDENDGAGAGASEESTPRGWNLLLSLNTLASSNSPQIIQLLCDASLPSTLIKCLYLFFDLPTPQTTAARAGENINLDITRDSFTRDIINGPLIKAFTQLSVKLCSNQLAIDELIKKDDLRLLIGIASSQCLPHNRPWRRTAFQTLLAISNNMRDNFMYLEQNMCIQIYVENMHRINSLALATTDELIEMIKTLLEFLYNLDVNNRNQRSYISPLLEQYKSSRLVDLIEELIVKIDENIMQEGQNLESCDSDMQNCSVSQLPSVSSEAGLCLDDHRRCVRRLIKSLTVMAKINVDPCTMSNMANLKPVTMSRFEMFEQFKMPRPSAKHCILNYEALRLLKMAWSKCLDSHIIEAILDVTIALFNDDKYNYFIFESHQLLVYYMTNTNFKSFPLKVKQKLFKFLEFIIIETNYIPCLELGTVGTIMEAKDCSDMDLMLGIRTLIACLRFNSKFSDIFREIGLLEIIEDLLIQTMQQYESNQRATKLEVLYLLLEASQYLVAGPNNLNCTQFNESGAARHVFNCLSKPEFFHLFVPAHGSGSDDCSVQGGIASRNDTPTSAQARCLTNQYSDNHVNHSQPSIKQLQKVAFTIIRQLILSTAGDEHLANLLGLLARNLDDLKSYEHLDCSNKSSSTSNDDNNQQTNETDTAATKSNQQLDLAFMMSQEVNLKICILKSLMIVLKDSHRCRILFRKAGGFIYIVSSLITLEKSLPGAEYISESESEHYARWKRVNSRRIWRLIKYSLMTIVVAIRFEPTNLRAFSDSVIVKFIEAISRLGCFRPDRKALPSLEECKNFEGITNFTSYKSIFTAPPTRDFSTIAVDGVKPDAACCQLFRFLYDMSLDMGDGTAELEVQLEQQEHFHKMNMQQNSFEATKSISFDQGSSGSVSKESGIFKRRSQLNAAPKRPPSLDLNSAFVDPAILTFPCIIVSTLDLIPCCPNNELMAFVCLVIKSLFKHERNQQMLCEAGMISKLLDTDWRISSTEKTHFLHETATFMLEKLAKQYVNVRELRRFLRLGDPLRCKNLDDIEVTESCEETRKKLTEICKEDSSLVVDGVKAGESIEKILTSRIEAFVSMMSDEHSKTQPPFVEFDMSTEGFSSIFMPSIAPVNAKSLPPNSSSFLSSTLDVHTNEKNGILGGVGLTERQFPPMTGLTFSTWICIEKFPARSSDASHNLRLLTIYRGSAATGKEYSCFRIQISALDRALTVSTQETLLFDIENRYDTQRDPDCNLRLWTPELLMEGKWHHVAVTMNRSLMKQSTINIFVDGLLVHSQRICYISSYVGVTTSGSLGNSNLSPASGGCSAAAYVNAFIGSLPQQRFRLRTQWKQGPCHLIEESLSANFIGVIHALGPGFIGNFQCPQKLQEVAANKDVQHSQVFDLNRHHHAQQNDSISGHKPLIHQQSVAVAHSQHMQLTRVSSSNVGSHTAGSHSQQTSSQNHYQLAEDRILMSVDARATSLMTLSRMRRIYTRFDCRQVSRVLGLALHENSTPILLLHNTGVHLNGPSRGVGALTIGHNHVRCFVSSPTQETLFSIGGCYIILGFIAQACTLDSFCISLRSLVCALKHNTKLQAQMDIINGYQMLSVLFWKKKHLLNSRTLKLTFSLITDSAKTFAHAPKLRGIQQIGAMRELICECFDLWLQTDMIDQVLEFIYDLISSTPQHDRSNSVVPNHTRVKNLKCLRDMDLLPRMLRLLPQYDSQQEDHSILKPGIKSLLDNKDETENVACLSRQTRAFDTKAVYLIKQTVFELLNRTPRQTDILYFGQFLASLLPSKDKERSVSTIRLRNILLKSLLQMMTKNNQREVNNAMQEELVRILGFDWFMLFINGSHLDAETVTIGFLNLMVVLSNEDLYANFKSKNMTNGGWLKEPMFPTIEGKFNIQLLGINVGSFFGLSNKRKAIRKEVLEASNFFLLSNCLTDLVELPRIYLMIFQTMMSTFAKLDAAVLDTIESFDRLSLDILCDCLVGDTHHKRRQTLAGIQFKCHELVVCIVYMLRDIMHQHEIKSMINAEVIEETASEINGKSIKQQSYHNYPVDVTKFLMYLYNNNQEFQYYCRHSDDLIDSLCATLMQPTTELDSETADSLPERLKQATLMTRHPAAKEVLELSRLIILDTMTDPNQVSQELGSVEQLHAFERFLDSLSLCREAQGELVDMLLRQLLLMIDSTSRHNSIKTIGSSENVVQFQLLLINSITICQIVTDKIWLHELYNSNWSRVVTIIDHQMCLAEQLFKFNELLPRHNPPHAFNMQRVLNRIILFALSRSTQHISDKMVMLDLLKKIHDNRTIVILNHMHSPQSAEFFVCLTYCLMKIITDNSVPTKFSSQQSLDAQPLSLIERQYGHPSLSGGNASGDPNMSSSCSSALMLVSMARKVWDAIYQSKKGILSEAFDVSLSLPAFTLDTSLDLIQLKPDIEDSCERFWSIYVESEQKPKSRLQVRQNEPAPGGSGPASSAVNILSGRLTRVVNAANFVSRVVGATAGTMASNVNLVGEKLGQNRGGRKEMGPGARSASDLAGGSGGPNSSAVGSQAQGRQSSVVGSASSQPSRSDLFVSIGLDRREIELSLQAHISIIEDYIESQLSQKNHKLALHKYLCDEWLDIEDEILLRERALFGPDYGSKLDKWCLDLTEGPRRMRKKMVNNTRQFYENYPYRHDQYNPSNKSLRYRPPMSYDSHLYYMKTNNLDDHLLELNDKLADSQAFENCLVVEQLDATQSTAPSAESTTKDVTAMDDGTKQLSPRVPDSPAINVDSSTPVKNGIEESLRSENSLPLNVYESSPSVGRSLTATAEPSSPRPSEGDQDDGDSTSFVDFSPEIEAETNSARESENVDSLSVLRLLEKNERISHMFRCSRVQGLDTYEGLLLFGREHFYLIDGFTLLKTREIKDIDSLPPDGHDPIIPNSTPNILAHSKKTCSKFPFDSVVEVHKRRYLLQPIALEVFSSDGRNTLVVFPRNIRNKVYSRLMAVSTQLNSNAHESLAGQKSTVSVEGGSGLLSNLIGETSVTQRWVRGELSNFQYLMNLNTIAGRSYNDLMQYPIFPWILADYTSDYLDLNKPSTFRDLSRPVGAQTSERLEQFKSRYADWDDTETPPYHYGTFYSSAMIVASYMVRMEPFTQHFLRLQGGHFDLADRMFHSIHDSWLSASKHNMADIKELVPEFFYLPEFLKNENKYDLGIKQNGKKLDDVILPPWAKSDAREFIRLHRSALESCYVSAHLHEWIDLIFGYKQQGQAAVDAVNVFHHLFYEGNVDIYNTDIDPIKKNAVIGFINNFGQVPKQLFKKPHPARKVGGSGGGPSSLPLTPILPSLTAVGSNAYYTLRVLTRCPQSLKQSNANYRELRGPVGQIVPVDKNIVAVEQNRLLIPPEYCRYVAWGHADRSIRLGLYDSEKPIFVWEGSDHMSPNEILSATIPNSRIMITAGTDSLITVWKIEKMRSFAPIMNLYGHVEPVTCLASSQSYSLFVSGSRDRTAIIWDLNRFTFVRQLGAGPSDKLVHQGPISAIAINDSTGDIATCASSWLYLWTINGELLAQIDTSSVAVQQQSMASSICGGGPVAGLGQLHILSVCFSQYNEWDSDEVIVTGGSDGSVAFWSMRYYQSPMSKAKIEDARMKEIEERAILRDDDRQSVDVEFNNNDAVTAEQARPAANMLASGDGESIVSGDDAQLTCESPTPPKCIDNNKPSPANIPPSEPIDIRPSGHQRSDTMNSEWVKLSTSSTSTTADTVPILNSTPTSVGDQQLQDLAGSGASYGTDYSMLNNATKTPPERHLSGSPKSPRCSTPINVQSVSGPGQNIEQVERSNVASTSNLSLAICDDPENEPIGKGSLYLAPNDPSLIKFSKSDTSLVDSFVLLGDAPSPSRQQGARDIHHHQKELNPSGDRVRPQSSADSRQPESAATRRARRKLAHAKHETISSAKLLPNHCWQRELYLRSVLPRRTGKAKPMAVTSLAISKDHRTLFVGDSSGHTTSWTTV